MIYSCICLHILHSLYSEYWDLWKNIIKFHACAGGLQMNRPHLTFSCAWHLQNTLSHVYEAEQEKEMSVFIIPIRLMKQMRALTATLSHGAAGHWTTSLARFLALPPVVSTSGPRSASALLSSGSTSRFSTSLDYGRTSRFERCVIDRPYRSNPVTHLVAVM